MMDTDRQAKSNYGKPVFRQAPSELIAKKFGRVNKNLPMPTTNQ